MTYQKTIWGTLIAAGIAVTGYLIYDDGSDRKYVRPVDMLELLEGTIERHAVLRPLDTWVDGDGTHYYLGTNTYTLEGCNGWGDDPLHAGYLIFTNLISRATNYVSYGFAVTSTVSQQEGRFVWGGYSNLTFTLYAGKDNDPLGVGLPGVAGSYVWSGMYNGYTYFTNTTSGKMYPDGFAEPFMYVLIDKGFEQGTYLALLESWTEDGSDPVWEWYDFSSVLWGAVRTPRGIVGDLLDINDNPYMYCSLTGGVHQLRDAPATTTYPAINTLVSATVIDMARSIERGVSNLIPRYADTAQAESGVFDTYLLTVTNIPLMTITGLFDRLNIGDGTNKLTYSPQMGTTAATYSAFGDVPMVLHSQRLFEVYRLLEACKWTTNGAVQWSGTFGTNSTYEQTFTDHGEDMAEFTPAGSECYPDDTWAASAFAWWEAIETPGGSAFYVQYEETVWFFDDILVSEWYPGATDTEIATGTSSPEKSYEWHFKFYKRAYLDIQWYEYPHTPPWAVGGILQYNARHGQTFVTKSAVPETVFRVGTPTNLPATVDYYAQPTHRWNPYSSDYTKMPALRLSSASTVVPSNTFCYTTQFDRVSAPSTNLMDEYAPEPTGDNYATGGDCTGPEQSGFVSATHEIPEGSWSSPAYSNMYYGMKYTPLSSVVKWQFVHCTNSL